MIRKNDKIYYDATEMISKMDSIVSASKLPRTCLIPIIRDSETGYINAAPYSGGVISLDPYMIIFGVKSWDAKIAFESVDDFTVSLCATGQLNDMFIMGNAMPHGINEIEVAGLTEYPLPGTDIPGIQEFPINLKCKLKKLIKLGGPKRNIVVAEVVGVSLDSNLVNNMDRAEAVNTVPLNESVLIHPYTKGYAPASIGKDLRGEAQKSSGHVFEPDKHGKVYIDKADFYKSPYNDAFIKAIFPRPNFVLMTDSEDGTIDSLPITGSLIMHTPPAVQIPVKKGDKAYENIKRNGVFTVSYPIWECEKQFLALRNNDRNLEGTGFTYDRSGSISTPGIKECPVNVECKVITIEDIPDTEYAVVIADKIGIYADEALEQETETGLINFFPRLIYSVMDYGMYERFGSMSDVFTCLPIPTYGSRQNGVWFTGPEQYQAGFQFWLLDLWLTGYIGEKEYYLIRKWILHFRYEGHYSPEPLRSQLRERITKALNLMTHAHRDFDKWQEIHSYLAQYIDDVKFTFNP